MGFIFNLRLLATVLLIVLASAHRDHQHARHARASLGLKNEAEAESAYWREKAQQTLAAKLESLQAVNTNRAKNVIMFLGDGMSIHTITATRNLLGDSSEKVYFEQFPYTGLSKTYCVNRQVADSACTATAYLGGVKGNYGTIGVNANVPRYDCTAANGEEDHVDSIAKWAQDAGKDAGFVTTARVTHASPAGVYAHTADRNWENDMEVVEGGCNPEETIDIARQLVEWEVGKNLKVILGGGKKNFLNNTVRDEAGQRGYRLDGRNLINEWLAEKQSRNVSANYVWSRKGLQQLDLDKTDYLLGLFANDHLPYDGDRERNHDLSHLADPSLTELTETALKVLQRNENGYFLFVEGARIDMAHHDNYARRSLEDTAEFARAIQKARELTSEEDTLIVVTSDHSHVFSINGYPERTQDITGLSGTLGDDNVPYNILSYANGPGYYASFSQAIGRKVITEKDTKNPLYVSPAMVPLSADTHGGDDVAVFASGPYAQYFSGTYEQANIPALMARAAGIGPYANV
ncbi:membrane-bound alkaline phosphatase [Drosophila sulfurigaster albostrigata]|uniref:membrane-bound alkaline phosphatase n=1 Tax=Drosophila sulfurigaster albostrigata TaxID=89887 RepID=UPI002D218879|nr:membrane-bound alkaline phosphatase [Drosophila sulfurigaster albostrigata]